MGKTKLNRQINSQWKKAELPIQLVTGWIMTTTMMMMIDREWEKESLNNTDKNQKKNPTKHLLVTWLNILTTVCFLGSPLFFPPHPCGSRSNSPKKNKKRKKKRARFTWCSSVCIALAVWYVETILALLTLALQLVRPPRQMERERYI